MGNRNINKFAVEEQKFFAKQKFIFVAYKFIILNHTLILFGRNIIARKLTYIYIYVNIKYLSRDYLGLSNKISNLFPFFVFTDLILNLCSDLTLRLTYSLGMAASSLFVHLHKPSCNFSFGPSSVPAYINSARFRSSRLISRRKIWSVFRPRNMADLVKTHALRDGNNSDGEERFQTLEQEAFISSPSELQNDLVADAGGGIEAVANRLVGIRTL